MSAFTMERFTLVYIFLAGEFNFVFSLLLEDFPTLGSNNAPRFITKDSVKIAFDYQELQNHTVLFYKQDYEDLYVGGTDFVLRLNTSNYHIVKRYDLPTTEPEKCPEQAPCENVITVIEEFDGSVFACGTNGYRPRCYALDSALDNKSEEGHDGTGISPFEYSQNSISLTVEGDLYAAAPLERDGSSLQFRRKAGKRTDVWMHDNWALEPTFISASWVKRENDSDNEKIYVFFREQNSDSGREADHWISRVARVCKVDEGGSKRFFQSIWTTFIKARLVCGFPEQSLYFNRLQDIYVLHDSNWNNTRVYAIFTSSWNSTAVCIYTIAMIEDIFENSTFKGYDQNIPSPRPGTCVKNSKTLPLATVKVVKDHPEMADWVPSVHRKAPFYVSSFNYTKIVVDQVRGADDKLYNVLLLATDSGKVHKVLEAGDEPFLISETRFLNGSAALTVKLDSKKKKLVVGFSDIIATVDLQRCEYGSSCEDCVLAQDPYCAWSQTAFQCTAAAPGNIQNVLTGNPNVCPEQETLLRRKRQTQFPSAAVHSVPLDMPFYLSCPIDSYHAEYSWEHGEQHSPCLQMKSDCLHLIPAMAQPQYGNYQCVSREKGYSKVVKQYQLSVGNVTKPDSRVELHGLNNALKPVTQGVWLTMGLLLTML
uniref:Semaphorin 7A n=1 Tax=Neogobius melanostomus TaxID=47308 RepID=A0A8C6WHZ0_9GOBI